LFHLWNKKIIKWFFSTSFSFLFLNMGVHSIFFFKALMKNVYYMLKMVFI
jgi:hypothetical protein